MSRASELLNRVTPAIGVSLGIGLAVSVWGGQSHDRVALNQQLQKFNELIEEQKRTVRLSYADLDAQSESRKAEIRAIHEAVQAEPVLRDTLERYYIWWSGLKQEDFDAFQEMNLDDRLTFARSRMNAEFDPAKQIVVEFGGPVSSRLPPLHMTFEEFGRIVTDAAADSEQPQSLKDELSALSAEPHRTLRLALRMFDSFPNQRDPDAMEQQSRRLRSAILQHVGDQVWAVRFKSALDAMSGRPFERSWRFMTLYSILSKGTITLGEDLHRQFPVTEKQIKDAFASLDDKELQQSLMTMQAAEAKTRLQFLAQTAGDKTPEEQLLVRYIDFARRREQILRFATFGFGGPSPFEPDRNGRKVSPRNERRGDGRPSPDDNDRNR